MLGKGSQTKTESLKNHLFLDNHNTLIRGFQNGLIFKSLPSSSGHFELLELQKSDF